MVLLSPRTYRACSTRTPSALCPRDDLADETSFYVGNDIENVGDVPLGDPAEAGVGGVPETLVETPAEGTNENCEHRRRTRVLVRRRSTDDPFQKRNVLRGLHRVGHVFVEYASHDAFFFSDDFGSGKVTTGVGMMPNYVCTVQEVIEHGPPRADSHHVLPRLHVVAA